MLDVAEKDRQRSEDDREADNEPDEGNEKRQRSPEGGTRRRDDQEVEWQDHSEHYDHGDQVRRDNGDREQLAREPNLLHEARLPKQARARHLNRGLHEEPDEQATEEEQGVVVDGDG